MLNSGANASPPPAPAQSRELLNTNNDFQFAFPKFGDLPSSFMSNGAIAKSNHNHTNGNGLISTTNPSLPNVTRSTSAGSPLSATANGNISPYNAAPDSAQFTQFTNNNFGEKNNSLNVSSYVDLAGLFSPSILENASRSNSADYISWHSGATSSPSTVRHDSISTANGQSRDPKLQRNSSASITASPNSSMSQIGLDSSCGTTPESTCDSPEHQRLGEPTLNTISEEATNQRKGDGEFY